MPSIDIIQFSPSIGGETTLVKTLSSFLEEMNYSIRVVHPCVSGKRGKKWCYLPNQNAVKYKELSNFIKETEIVLFVNSLHLTKFHKKEKREEAFKTIESIYNFENKNVIFYEHGIHSSSIYDYPRIFEILKEKNNKIIVFTNTKEVIPYYENLGYNAFLIRQPFDPKNYPEIRKPDPKNPVQICFNSRYVINKRPHHILPFFEKYIGKSEDFEINFRGSVKDTVSFWTHIIHYFDDPKFVMKECTEESYEIYHEQDYCIYAGYLTLSERGKMEYSMLESFYYGIPLIVEREVINNFKFDEYGISKDDFLKCVIPLNEENIEKIINRKFEWKSYTENAKRLVEDFLPHSIKSRLSIGLSGFEKPLKKRLELF